MTTHDDLDRRLDAFLQEGPAELPTESYEAARERIGRTRQRVITGSWRFTDMNKLIPVGIGAAALIGVVFVGAQVFGPAGDGGPGASPVTTPTPSLSPSNAPTVAPSPAAGLPVGPHVLASGTPATGPLTVTIPAPGWYGDPSGGILVKDESADPPDGAGLIVFAEGDGWYVPANPCTWASTIPESPSSTVDELITALAAQASRDASAPVDTTVGGFPGKAITLTVPDDARFTDCDAGQFCTLAQPEVDPASPCFRHHQGPGQIDTLWIADVNGQLVVIDWARYAATPAEHVTELEDIVGSIAFE